MKKTTGDTNIDNGLYIVLKNGEEYNFKNNDYYDYEVTKDALIIKGYAGSWIGWFDIKEVLCFMMIKQNEEQEKGTK